jgi:uracil-DNA glycosylase family 4
LAYVRNAIQDYSLSKLNQAISSCNICKLNSPKSLGSGNIHGSVMIIADYPSAFLWDKKQNIKILQNTEKENIEYHFLNTICQNLHVDINEFFFMNTVNCCCHTNGQLRPPGSQEIKNCSVFVKYAVDLMHPTMIILLGNIALNIFKRESMTKAHGQWINAYTIPAMPIYSPHYLHSLIGKMEETKRQQLIAEMWADFKHAFEYLKNQYPNAKIFLNAESEE